MRSILRKWFHWWTLFLIPGCKSKQIQNSLQSQINTQELKTSTVENLSQKESIETSNEYWTEYSFEPFSQGNETTVILRSIRKGIKTTESLEKFEQKIQQLDSISIHSDLNASIIEKNEAKPSNTFPLLSIIGMLLLLMGFVFFLLLKRK